MKFCQPPVGTAGIHAISFRSILSRQKLDLRRKPGASSSCTESPTSLCLVGTRKLIHRQRYWNGVFISSNFTPRQSVLNSATKVLIKPPIREKKVLPEISTCLSDQTGSTQFARRKHRISSVQSGENANLTEDPSEQTRKEIENPARSRPHGVNRFKNKAAFKREKNGHCAVVASSGVECE